MHSYILPLALNYLAPLPVSIIGIGAVAAAVMSSADSCILSTSSVITKNIYRDIFRPNASQRETLWVLRISIVVVGILSTLIAMFATTIYGLYILCSDLMYVVLFPQLTLVLWAPFSNAYGSLAGFCTAFVLRLLSGEPIISLPAVIRYPLYDEATQAQLFPHRTFVMLVGLVASVLVSVLSNGLFRRGILPARWDVCQCLAQRTAKMRPRGTNKLHHETAAQNDPDVMELKRPLEENRL